MNRKGREGEERAAVFLQDRGYEILARNFYGPSGEIDIVALRDDTLAFIEVKSWDVFPKEDLGRSIDARKRERIAETALFFLHKHREYSDYRIRYDLIFLSRMTGETDHMTDAFS